MRIETHVVDVRSGVLEASYLTEGRVEDFAKLRANVVLEAVTRLDLPVTDAERRALLAQREVEVEPVKRLLESESALGATPNRLSPRARRAAILALAMARPRRRLGDAAPAAAQESAPTADPGDAKRAIGDLLERYRKAIEPARSTHSRSPTRASPEQRAKQQRYFEGAGTCASRSATSTSWSSATRSGGELHPYRRLRRYRDGRPFHASVRLTKTVRREGVLEARPGG